MVPTYKKVWAAIEPEEQVFTDTKGASQQVVQRSSGLGLRRHSGATLLPDAAAEARALQGSVP